MNVFFSAFNQMTFPWIKKCNKKYETMLYLWSKIKLFICQPVKFFFSNIQNVENSMNPKKISNVTTKREREREREREACRERKDSKVRARASTTRKIFPYARTCNVRHYDISSYIRRWCPLWSFLISPIYNKVCHEALSGVREK